MNQLGTLLQIYLCVEDICEGDSRFIENMNDLAPKGSQHHGHDCLEINGIKQNIQDLLLFWESSTFEIMKSDMDSQCNELKKVCLSLIDEFFAQQKILIQKKIQSTNKVEIRSLFKAVQDRDLVFLQKNQQFYKILRQPELILQDHQEQFKLISNEVSKNSDLIKKNLHDIFNIDLQLNLANLNKSVSEHISQIQQQNKELAQQDNKIEQLYNKQQGYVLKIENLEQVNKQLEQMNKQLEQMNKQLELQKNTEGLIIKDIAKRINQDGQKLEQLHQQVFGFKQGGFQWSKIHKHNDIKISGQVVQHNFEGGYNAVFMEPQISFHTLNKVRLKQKKNSYSFVQICDLKQLKTKCQSFRNIHQLDFGTYSQRENGGKTSKSHMIILELFCTDTYVQGSNYGFEFRKDDILELQWNGPLKVFTTVNVTKGRKFEFKVNFKADAELFFAVSCHGPDSSFELI